MIHLVDLYAGLVAYDRQLNVPLLAELLAKLLSKDAPKHKLQALLA